MQRPLLPCIPVTLPLKSLKEESFSHLLPEAYSLLDQFNQRVLLSPLKMKKIMFKEELKASARLPREALDFVMKKRRISLKFLCDLHKLAQRPTKGVDPKDIGQFRNRQNWIGPENRSQEEAYFYPPDLFYLKKGLKNLQKYLKHQNEDPLVQLAIFFAQFLILHPFMDGNGRVARLVIAQFLYEKKIIGEPLFFMSHYFKKHRVDYFHKLYLISSKGKWEGWIRFFLKGIVEEGTRILKLYQRK